MSELTWQTTSPNPRSPSTGYDAGQRGWCLHLVDLSRGPVMPPSLWGGGERNRSPALCGLSPRHGWGLDLFIDAECARCASRAAKLKLTIPESP